jgi:glycolate oxidase iron-sulfur subunit
MTSERGLKSAADTNRVSLPLAGTSQATSAGYERFLDCVHCGLCLSSCPTYTELGSEMDSPRGRIYLMRAVADRRIDLTAEVRDHLDLCLDCRACETACPSGVQYGKIIEPFRIAMAREVPHRSRLSAVQRGALFHLFPYARRMRWAIGTARLGQRIGLDWLRPLLPRRLRLLHEMLPPLTPRPKNPPTFLPAFGRRRACVALFTGCVGDAVFPETTHATVTVLRRNGCDVTIPKDQTCCGAIHYHSGWDDPARRFARKNLDAFDSRSFDAIVANAAGCGAMLKDYGHLLGETVPALAFSKKIRDISEFLVELGPIPPTNPVKITATYHDPCHLCHAQKVREAPRTLLEMIPGLDLRPLEESEMCCGAAGTYNLSQPEMAARLGERKVEHILATKAQAVFTGNVGCLMQIGRHLRPRSPRTWLAHPMDVLCRSYGGDDSGPFEAKR